MDIFLPTYEVNLKRYILTYHCKYNFLPTYEVNLKKYILTYHCKFNILFLFSLSNLFYKRNCLYSFNWKLLVLHFYQKYTNIFLRSKFYFITSFVFIVKAIISKLFSFSMKILYRMHVC